MPSSNNMAFTALQWHGRGRFETAPTSHTSQWILCTTAGWVNRRSRPGKGPGICPVYVRYIILTLFCKPLDNWGGHFRILNTFVTSNGLMWSKCVGICTDGAKAMTGRHSGVVTYKQAVAPNTIWVHCSIHWEALAVKGMSVSSKDILDTTVKLVIFVKARPLNSRIYCIMQWNGK